MNGKSKHRINGTRLSIQTNIEIMADGFGVFVRFHIA